MGNTDKFEMIANIYDTSERIQIAKVSSNAIREYLVDTKSKNAIDFGCGTGLVGMNLLNDFNSMLFLDTSQNMISQITQKFLVLIYRMQLHYALTLKKTVFRICMQTIFLWLRFYSISMMLS